MALTPQQAIDELTGQDSLHGLDLTPEEALRLLNEADADMSVRSGWTRERLELGPAVADQSDYDLPESVYQPLHFYVDGLPYEQGDEDMVSRINTDTSLQVRGIWYLPTETTLAIYPLPAGGESLLATCVVYPTEFTASGAFHVPPDSRRALLNYVRYVSLGSSEDDSSRIDYAQEYEAELERLRRRRISRVGRGGAKMRIRGVTA